LILPPSSRDQEPTQASSTALPDTPGTLELHEEPYCWDSHEAIDHFTGPWSLIGVGFDGDGGWAAIQAYIDVGIEGLGEPFDQWTNVEDIRARTWDWASLLETEVRSFLHDNFTWITSSTTKDTQGNDIRHIHRHTGNWTEWHNSLTTNGRWLDPPAPLGVLGTFDCAAFVIEARDGDVLCYHFGDIKRQDRAVLYLGLHNRRWYFIRPRPSVSYPPWWHDLPRSWPDLDLFTGR
jgi:hypothetical protein